LCLILCIIFSNVIALISKHSLNMEVSMKLRPTLSFLTIVLSLIFLFPASSYAQTFDGTWGCVYATIDDQPNSTGYNTPAVGVIKENTFVALVQRKSNSTCLLVGYTNADSINGRMGNFGYGSSGLGGYRQQWSSGFDVVEMLEAVDIAATPDSFVYVANNDPGRNILVFKMSADSVISTEYRMVTGADSIWAIDVDANGYVYVTTVDTNATGKVLVFKPFGDDPEWSGLHSGSPISTITIPDPGTLRGVAVDPSGSVIYVSNYQAKKVYCYTGDPVNGYTQFTGFNYLYTDTTGVEFEAGPWGLGYMPEKNILFMAADVDFHTSNGYNYGKIFLLNPNTGAELDTIDCAEWNFVMTGGYSTRASGTTPGNASGYTSVFNVDFDESFNLYDQSYYGWTVDKWVYSGTLPTIPLTIVNVKKTDGFVPSEFKLNQNYPNPFNPATTIEFAVTQRADVSLKVYNITGELVTTLINSASFEAGNYSITLDASRLASGTYIYVLTNGTQQLSKKMTLLK
ncbi:MAG: T9SS type A sorting domain-containing protein, partial [Ignavibacteriaceae bacterium]|nr:T9SS type A sorting domain-containing protein [Ignavibacteriaceae bacterium]